MQIGARINQEQTISKTYAVEQQVSQVLARPDPGMPVGNTFCTGPHYIQATEPVCAAQEGGAGGGNR